MSKIIIKSDFDDLTTIGYVLSVLYTPKPTKDIVFTYDKCVVSWRLNKNGTRLIKVSKL